MYFIEYEDRQSGKTYTKYFHNRPVVTNAYCPICGNQVMERKKVCCPFTEDETNFECLHCGTICRDYDTAFTKANSNCWEPILYLDVYETNDKKVKLLADEEITPPTSAAISKDAIFVDLDIIEKLLAVIDYIDYEKIKRVFIVLVQNIFNNKDFSIEEEIKNRLLKIQPKLYKYLESLEDSNKKIGYFDALFDLIVEGLA